MSWLIFYCDLLSLYPPVNFLSLWLSGFITITNSNGDSASSWNIPPWIFSSAKLLPPAVNYTLQVFTVFLIKFMTLKTCTLWGSLLSSLVGPYHMPVYSQSIPELDFPSGPALVDYVLINVEYLFCTSGSFVASFLFLRGQSVAR